MFPDSLFIAPLHFGQRSRPKLKVKDAKIPKSFPVVTSSHMVRLTSIQTSVFVFQFRGRVCLLTLQIFLLISIVIMDSRKRLRSSSTPALVAPFSCRTTIGDRAFLIAAPRAWNTLHLASLRLRHSAPSSVA